jgi:two-component system, LuxR family, sensor histidine kinase TtrS
MNIKTNRVLHLPFLPQFFLPLMHSTCRAILFVGLLCYSLSLSAQTAMPITIGTITGQIKAPNSFLPFTEYLDSRLPGYTFEVVGFSSIEALIQAIKDQSLDLAFITPAALIEINQESESRILATITQPAANTFSPWLAGAVFTRGDNTNIQSMSDIRGSKVVALSELALGGWLSAVRDWQELGINIESDLESVEFLFSYDGVIDSVCSGEADAGVIAASTFQNF